MKRKNLNFRNVFPHLRQKRNIRKFQQTSKFKSMFIQYSRNKLSTFLLKQI